MLLSRVPLLKDSGACQGSGKKLGVVAMAGICRREHMAFRWPGVLTLHPEGLRGWARWRQGKGVRRPSRL